MSYKPSKVSVMREAITKVTQILSGRSIKVIQQGMKAAVQYDPLTHAPVAVFLPMIPDDASDELLDAVQGFLDHEVGHLLNTDGPTMLKAFKSLGPEGASILNMVEDVFVEKKQAAMWRGTASNMTNTGMFYLKNFVRPKLATALANDDQKAQVSLLMPSVIRALGGQFIFQEYLDEIDHPIANAITSKLEPLRGKFEAIESTADSVALTKEILRLLNDQSNESGDSGEEDQEQQGGKGDKKKKPKENKPTNMGGSDNQNSDPEENEDDEEGDQQGSGQGDDQEGEGDQEGDGEGQEGEGEDGDSDSDGSSGGGDRDSEQESGDQDGQGGSSGQDQEGEGDDSGQGGQGDAEDGEGSSGQPTDGDGEPSDADQSDADSPEDRKNSTQEGGHANTTGQAPEQQQTGGLTWAEIAAAAKEATDFDDAAAESIGAEATKALKNSSYVVWSTEFDEVEVLKVDPRNRDHFVESCTRYIEEPVQAMVSPMTKELERAIAARSHSLYVGGYRSGRLHGASLTRLKFNDDRVFRRKTESTTKDVVVELVVDVSGSMGGSKVLTASRAAFALASVLDRLGIKNEVICFTTGRCVVPQSEQNHALKNGIAYARTENIIMPIIKTHDEVINSEVRARFGRMPNDISMSCNIDGESVEMAARRLLQRKASRHVMIVLSDGEPAGHSMVGRDVLFRDLKDRVQKIERSGVDVVAIGIESTAVERFYSKNVVLQNVKDLPTTVIRELRHLLIPN